LARNRGRRYSSFTTNGGNNSTRRFAAVISSCASYVGAVRGYVARQGSVGALGVNMGGGDLMKPVLHTVHKKDKKDRKDSKSSSHTGSKSKH
jgi:hypothetical protein